jgi:hypothetical protein
MDEAVQARRGDEGEQQDVHRLRDIVVEEVSLVDRAANKRRFLVVKRSEDMGDSTRVETEGRSDERGSAAAGRGVAKAKKKPGAGADSDKSDDEEKRKKPVADGGDDGDEAEKARRREMDDAEEDTKKARRAGGGGKDDEDDDEEDGVDTEKAKAPKDEGGDDAGDEEDGDGEEEKRRKAAPLFVPKPVKEAVLRALTEALDRLLNVAKRVKEAEPATDQAATALPDHVGAELRSVAEALQAVGKTSVSADTGAVAKGGARMSKDRLDRFQKAMALLADILKELTDTREAPPEPTAGAAQAGVAKRDARPGPAAVPGVAELVAGVAELTRVVKRQEQEIVRLRQARGVSNAIPVEGAPRREPAEVSWPIDMNRPITKDKVKKEVSFFED